MKKENIFLFLTIILVGCATLNQNTNSSSVASLVEIPPQHIMMTKPTMDHVELREGPSHKHKIVETLEDKNMSMLVLSETTTWTKVFVLMTQKTGWVHQKALIKPILNTDVIQISIQALPIFFARDKAEHAGYTIEKGDLLYGIRKEKNKVLVWSQELKAFIWLEKQKVV